MTKLDRLMERAEELRLTHNAIPWWKTFKRQDAAREYRWALYNAAVEEVFHPPIRDGGSDD